MRCIALLLALGLLAGSALADLSPPKCGPGGMGGGWTPVTGDDVPQEVVDAVVNTVMGSVAGNITDLLAQQGLLALDGNQVEMGEASVAGCSQVVKGTNYKLWINLTTTVGDSNLTLGLTAEVYNPLPANNGGAGEQLTVYDIDFEFIMVDGVIVAQDMDGDDDDQWDVDSDGMIVSNGNWTGNWSTDDLADDVFDLLNDNDDDMPGDMDTDGDDDKDD